MGDLPRTTDTLYGPCLHKYTIKEAIHDEAVLGFMIEYLHDKGIDPGNPDIPASFFESEQHMLMVLETILNKSDEKFGIANGRGMTYSAILTTTSIPVAQRYYDLLKRVVAGETPIRINEEIRMVLPDFPKFAITYSVTENEEDSTTNQDRMAMALKDYNDNFGTHFTIEQLSAYNRNLTDRLARKMDKYKTRTQQLDLVIVVNRLLTGFDAPCLSTLFIDRPPMQYHDIVQALSRTNRLFDKRKQYGQIVTFQHPEVFKRDVDAALTLFSAGGLGDAVAGDWEETERDFIKALVRLRETAPTPSDVAGLDVRFKKKFARAFQKFDRLLVQLRSFTRFVDENKSIEDYGITQQEYEDYTAHYNNVIEDLRNPRGDGETAEDPEGGDDPDPVNTDYEPLAYTRVKIDYEYIISLIQDIVSNDDEEEDFKAKAEEVRGYIEEFSVGNEKLGAMMLRILNDIEKDRTAFSGKNISEILADMRQDAIETVVDSFVARWFVDRDAILYAVYNNVNGDIPNASVVKDSLQYAKYRASTEGPLRKPKARSQMISELTEMIQNEILPLQVI